MAMASEYCALTSSGQVAAVNAAVDMNSDPEKVRSMYFLPWESTLYVLPSIYEVTS